MADLYKFAQEVNICVRKKDIDIETYDDKIQSWLKEYAESYAYIYHKEDVNLEGLIEDKHIHIVVRLKKRARLMTTFNSFTNALTFNSVGVMIDKCNSFVGSIQYLIHKNDVKKTPHSINEIITSFSKEELQGLMGSDIETLTAQRLFNIIKDSTNNIEIINALGLGVYRLYRPLINDIKEDLKWKSRGVINRVRD